MKTVNVFVYGTLLVGERNHHVASPYLCGVKTGKVKGHLYHVGGFPALVVDPNGQEIEGEWFTVTLDGLRNMDRLEGYVQGRDYNHYERVEITDVNGKQRGFVYTYTKEQAKRLPKIESGSWRKRTETKC